MSESNVPKQTSQEIDGIFLDPSQPMHTAICFDIFARHNGLSNFLSFPEIRNNNTSANIVGLNSAEFNKLDMLNGVGIKSGLSVDQEAERYTCQVVYDADFFDTTRGVNGRPFGDILGQAVEIEMRKKYYDLRFAISENFGGIEGDGGPSNPRQALHHTYAEVFRKTSPDEMDVLLEYLPEKIVSDAQDPKAASDELMIVLERAVDSLIVDHECSDEEVGHVLRNFSIPDAQ